MRLNARKTLIKALGDASLRDFKDDVEMSQAKNLYLLMTKNDSRDEDINKPQQEIKRSVKYAVPTE